MSWNPAIVIEDCAMYSWSSQEEQYPDFGETGLSYFRGEIDEEHYVDCLLWRDAQGHLTGILNHYPMDIPPFEEKGNVNIWVKPRWQGRGIATALLDEARKRWSIDLSKQRYSESGAGFIARYVKKRNMIVL